MEKKSKVIAIDGPSGSGKSTIAKLVASKLKLTYLDTGAMFRGIAYHLDSKGITAQDVSEIDKTLKTMKFIYAKSDSILVEIDGVDLSLKIREHHVSELASVYSQVPCVRIYLKELQREIVNTKPSILEGRDIGTVIFPNAALKFFLTADPKVRAQRRLAQLKEKDPNTELTVTSILADIEKRDMEDSGRAIAPLVKAEDAIEVDTTSLSIDEVAASIAKYFSESISAFE